MLYNTLKRGADKAKNVLASPCWSSMWYYPAFRSILGAINEAETGVVSPGGSIRPLLTRLSELRDAIDTGATRVDKNGKTLDRVGRLGVDPALGQCLIGIVLWMTSE